MKLEKIPAILLLTLLMNFLPAEPKPNLKPGEYFPVIDLPRSDTGDLESIADHLEGKKLLVHLFAGW